MVYVHNAAITRALRWNQTIIELLEITAEEEREMRTVISDDEHRRRDRQRKNPEMTRREYEGRAADRRSEARRMASDGLRAAEIAKILEVSIYSGSGTPSADPNLLSGGGGDDVLWGHNRLFGGAGNDQLIGYSYWSQRKGTTRTFKPGPGEDTVRSNNNTNDTVYAVDDERDTISCGGGTDTVYFDKGTDSVNPAYCEKRIGK